MMITAILRRASTVSNGVIAAANSGQLHQLSAVTNRPLHTKSQPLLFRRAGFPDYPYDGSEICNLDIPFEMISTLANKRIWKLLPIQRAVLKPATLGNDIIGLSRRGSGKTLAYGIPMIDNIIRLRNENGWGQYPLGLVLVPKRQLAMQVHSDFKCFKLDNVCIHGGDDAHIQRQVKEINYGIDVVIGTPGRVAHLLREKSLVLKEIQHVVLDEADKLLQASFHLDFSFIFQEHLHSNWQVLIFSESLLPSIAQRYVKNPITVDLLK